MRTRDRQSSNNSPPVKKLDAPPVARLAGGMRRCVRRGAAWRAFFCCVVVVVVIFVVVVVVVVVVCPRTAGADRRACARGACRSRTVAKSVQSRAQNAVARKSGTPALNTPGETLELPDWQPIGCFSGRGGWMARGGVFYGVFSTDTNSSRLSRRRRSSSSSSSLIGVNCASCAAAVAQHLCRPARPRVLDAVGASRACLLRRSSTPTAATEQHIRHRFATLLVDWRRLYCTH